MAGLAEQVLDHFRDRFIEEVDANTIVLELEYCGIISNGDQTEVRQETNATEQNRLLHACLKKKCTVEALMVVCDVITKVKGNPKLKSLGEDMKTELEKDLPQSSEDLELQEPVAKKLVHDYTALERDHLVRDISDLHYESDPKDIIKLLYGNALATISDLLEPHLKDVKKAAYRLNDLELHHVAVGEGIIESADSIDSLLRQMSVTKMWHETRFLRKAIASIPQSESDREVAEAILFHYNQHLAIYKRATCLKDAISKESETEEEAKVPVESNELVPLKITSRKDFSSFSCEDCYILQVRGLKKAYGIPEEKIICHEVEDGHSTTITFLIPRQYSHNVIQCSGRLDTIWILLELEIIEVSIPGVFTFVPSVGFFLSQLRGSNPFTADLLGVTEVLPYQTYCLLDPDTKEPLSGRPLSTKRIEQHWDSHDTPKHPVERTGRVVTMRDTTVDSILQEFRGDILNNVNAKECAPELRRQKVIAEGTETDIERARDARKASGILYDYLRMNCTLEQIVVFSRVLMEVDDGLGRTKNVGYRLHAKIQEGGAVASDQKVSPDESPLNPSTHKAEVNTVQRQGITASPHSKVSFGRCRVPVTCVCLAVLIPFVGVAVCLCPLPFANYWQHRMCPSGITWPWDWGQSDTCTAAEMDTSSIVQERHTQGSDEDADIHSQMSIMETSKHARSARSTTNQPQPTSTSLEDDTDEELSDLIQVSELHTDLTKEDLRHLQSVGQNDLVWVEIGVTGVGKSTLGNFLLGKDAFKVGSALKSVTDKAEVDCSAVNDQRMCIVDTPGFGDTRRMVTKNTEAENLASDAAHLIVELSKTMLMAQHGINAFFVVVRADSRELFSTMKLLDLLDILGNYWNHSILVFTHGKEFDKASEERQYAEFEAMLESPSCPDVWQALMEKVSNCYVIVEPEEWKDDKEYRLQKLTEFRKHTSHIAANSGPYNDTLHSLVREYIETAKLELRHDFSDVDSPEAQVAALQVAFENITSMLYKLIRIKLAGGVDTELLQKMANVKEEQLTEVRKQRDLLYEQLLKEQEEKRRAQAEEEKAREEERKAKERERAMAEERRLALEREEKARKELEEYLKKPTFTERRIETKITRSGFYKWEYVHTAEAVDVATGIRAKAKNYKSKDGAKEHARANLKAILLERGVIRKD